MSSLNNLFDSRLLQMYRLTVKLIVLDYVGNAGHRQKVTRESGGQSGCGRSQIFNPITMRTHTPACAHTQTLHTHRHCRQTSGECCFFLRGMRWAVGGGWGRGEALTLTRERGAGGWSSFLLLSHNRGRGILVRCGLWREHTYLRALAYTLHTQSDSFS